MQNIKAYIHDLIYLIRLRSTGETLHLALQSTPKYLLNYRIATKTLTTTTIYYCLVSLLLLQLLYTEAGVVAGINDIPQKLVSVLLAA